MVDLQSPGIDVEEFDGTLDIVGISTTTGALAGVFRWGPVGQRTVTGSEGDLKAQFGGPTNLNYETWFTGANFLAYADEMIVVRAANTTGLSTIVTANVSAGNTVVNVGTTVGLGNGFILIAASDPTSIRVGTTASVINATHIVIATASDAIASANGLSLQFVANTTAFNAIVNSASVSDLTGQIVRTEDDFNTRLDDADFDENVSWIARWPGALGNSLKVSVCDSSDAFEDDVDLSSNGAYTGSLGFSVGSNVATVTVGANATAVGFNVNSFNSFVLSLTSDLSIGDIVEAGNNIIGTQDIKVTSIGGFSNVGLTSNNGVNTSITSGSPNLTTTGNAFSGLSAGDFIVVWANTTSWSTFTIGTASSGNGVVLTTNATFSVANAVWAELNATSASFSLNLEDKYRRSTDSATGVMTRRWEYSGAFAQPPGQSSWVLANGNTAAEDELHVVVVDEDGKFTGVPGTVLEKFENLSRATDAKADDGPSIFYRNVINSGSAYVWNIADASGASSNDALDVTSSSNEAPFTSSFALGADGSDESSIAIGTLTDAYDQFASVLDSDIALVMQGKARGGSGGAQLANYLIDNIAEFRKDCVVFTSPDRTDVVNNVGSELADVVAFRNNLSVSSYGFMDSGYKYQYDRYNDLYRYVPLNGDIAGLVARTEFTNDAWWSPAGFNRGQIKNVVRLVWNPKQAERDELYQNSVNPVVTFPGDGTLLYGDKTLLSKPSAFDRINVRRLFIVLEKTISKSAKYTLFEFNDAYTRAAFRNLVIPYLRDVEGRRGITDFLVVCDDTNNTPEVIDANKFIADILIKPSRSINYVTLNFYGVPTGVAFSEVVRSSSN